MASFRCHVRYEEGPGWRATWFEVELDRGWLASYRVVPQDGQPVFAELRILRGQLSGRGRIANEEPDELPPDGITSRLLRQIRTEEHLKLALSFMRPEQLEPDRYQGWDVPEAWGFVRYLEKVPPRTGRKKLPDEFYAIVAKLYVDAVAERPHAPYTLLVEWLAKLPEPYRRQTDAKGASTLIGHIRSRGFLTSAPARGRAGGELKARTIAILATIDIPRIGAEPSP